MQRLIAAILSRWVISLVCTGLLAGLLWVFGPFLPQLESFEVRLALIAAMLLICVAANVALDLWRKRRDAALAQGVTATQGGPASVSATDEEAEALSSRLATALKMLQQARRSRGYLYEQPWYAIIGPPGAGKTTALLNAGLEFPLAAAMGQGAMAGVGGTRLCDWWFTDDAVLIDTAGRYTTQDSNAAVDRVGWETFLDLLKRTRPREPLNGVIVAFALSDIAGAAAGERLAHAEAIRRRVKELEARLGIRMPVYAMFTKADLIAGFTEFFDDLDREGRAQVWGTTFPLADGAGAVAGFTDEFRALVDRLNQRLFRRLHDERNPERRALIAMFPGQIASLEEPLIEFLQAAFGGSRSDPPLLLRGAYLTSGTQEGTPVDRLTRVLAQAFGVDQAQAPSLRPERGRSYFLEYLLRGVIFGEAMLISQKPGAARRRILARAFGCVVAASAVVAMAVLLWQISGTGEREIDAMRAALNGYEQTAQTLPLDPVTDADLPRLVPLLDMARALPHGVDQPTLQPPSWRNLWLSQDAKLAAASRAVYRHALEWALLPRLVWRLEAQIRGNLNRPDFVYEATRVYLMLGNAGPLDRALVHDWMQADWQIAFPGAALAPVREALLRHLDALLAQPLAQVALDGELVAQARATFAQVNFAERVYSRIRPSATAQRVAPWRPSDPLGAAGAALFVRASGKRLTDGIPGFFTYDGFHKVLLPSLPTAAKDVASEGWVLGQAVTLDPNGEQAAALARDVIALYQADYVKTWDAMLADLNVVQQRSLSQAAQDLYILASPQSPMRSLLVSIAHQLNLAAPPAGTEVASRGVVTPANPGGDEIAARIQSVFGTAQAISSAPLRPGHEISEHYQALIDLVADGPGAPIDQVLRSLGDMQQQLAKMAATLVNGGTPAAPSGIDPALALRTEAARQPQPLARWLTAIATTGSALRGGNSRQQLAAMFNAADGPGQLCPLVVNGRYPFVPTVPQDASPDDFSRLFAPGGLLDGFINTLLRPYVDMTGSTWRVLDSASAPVSAADLAQFQRAAAIRDAFFADGGGVASLRLDITPVSLDAGATRVTLDLGGASVTYSHGPARATQITWPGPNQAQLVSLTFEPPPAGRPGVLRETGPWSILRLFARGKLQQVGTSDRYNLTFQLGERQAVFELHASTKINPFTPALLQDFHCPTVQ